MKYVSVAVALLSICCSTSAFAGAAINKLKNEVEAQSTFTQTTAEARCPERIQLRWVEFAPEWYQPTDVGVYLAGKSVSLGGQNTFTHEGNVFALRQNLQEGKTHLLDRSVSFPAGVAYSVTRQREENGVFTSEYKARIASVVMVATSHYVVSYDAKLDQITYKFTGGGVAPARCEFKKDSPPAQ